ncbi:hypothetical protein HDU98_007192 [Podochytrium sp. JEL0797]|nr:hypothetical protein HDU98_007192 [Podochytrium sp. JEL0797]
MPPSEPSQRQFPPTFTTWLATNGVEPSDYDSPSPIPRFIRINPSALSPTCTEESIITSLAQELNTAIDPVPWLADLRFYKLDAGVKISGSKAYESGMVYGMDVASGVAVHALGVETGDHVLDLCCAPGAKMCLIADLQGRDSNGTVTGVDVSSARIATCKSVLRKYKVERFRLFDCDGMTFDVHAPSRVGKWTRPAVEVTSSTVSNVQADVEGEEPAVLTGKRKRELTKESNAKRVKPFLATKMLIGDPQIKSDMLLYDKVLVDAECTHDGSIAHLKKCDQVGWERFESNFFDPVKMDALEVLQRGLLSNGFRLLKANGILVYSTCSFSRRQNEDIVIWFLKHHPNASLEMVPGSASFPLSTPLKDTDLCMLRFSPSGSKTSGLFIARIRKRE